MAEILDTLLAFQPDAPELQQKRDYDKHIREFVAHITSIPASQYTKGADTPQDFLSVGSSGAFLSAL